MNYFTNRNGLRLAYNFSIKNPNDRKIYITCLMWPTQLFWLCGFIFEFLEANTFKFDFTGDGDSEGEHSHGSYRRDADDIEDAVKFLNSRGYEVSGIIAYSKYTTGLFLYSALYGEVKNIIAIAPRFHMHVFPKFLEDRMHVIKESGWIIHEAYGRTWKITMEMVQEMRSIDMKYYCERAKGDIYIIHGDSDEICPYSDSLEFVNEVKEKCKGHFTLNCDHYFVGVFDEVVEIIQKIISGN
ncbi:unnamed protein product [Blepharisma stoltei]|uniref:Alpha/beta hydrolase n=1 Tax=Blepharisma stoltei TaxID=1481888 RepID=A0AAU9JWT6_9CILI|nr:unnamed protein product [Blepharisma stoltei]